MKYILSCNCSKNEKILKVIYWYYTKNGGGWATKIDEAYYFTRPEIEGFLKQMKDAPGLRPHLDFELEFKILKTEGMNELSKRVREEDRGVQTINKG